MQKTVTLKKTEKVDDNSSYMFIGKKIPNADKQKIITISNKNQKKRHVTGKNKKVS